MSEPKPLVRPGGLFFYLVAATLAVLGGLEIYGQVEFVSYLREGEQGYRGSLRAVVFYGWLILGSLYGARAFGKSEDEEGHTGIGLFLAIFIVPVVQLLSFLNDVIPDKNVDWGLQGTVLLLTLLIVGWMTFFITSRSLRES